MTIRPALLALAACLAGVAPAQDPTVKSDAPEPVGTVTQLHERLDSVVRVGNDAVAGDLDTLVKFLQAEFGIVAVVDPAARREIDARIEVRSVAASSLTLRRHLQLMLEPSGLAAANDRGVLLLTTESRAEQILTTRVYPLPTALRGADDADVINLLLLHTDTTWDNDGGPGRFTKTPFGLVVTAGPAAHAEIGGLLRSLSTAAAGQPEPQPEGE